MRSLLFVPGDRPDRFSKAIASGADALILDLEDSVSLGRKTHARQAISEFTSIEQGLPVFVRVNPLTSRLLEEDLQAITDSRITGLVLPKCESGSDVQMLSSQSGRPDLKILPVTTETPKAVFGLSSYANSASTLAGLTWGAEDLPVAIGASSSREDNGTYTPPYELVRSLTLFGAHAAEVPAIETVFPDIRNLDALAAYASRGRRDGFSGMMAIHPAQITVINDAFTPSADEIAHARKIVAAFAADPDAGALQLDGMMIDAPHLKQARRLLSL
nr:CoA ester lyase [Henriciella sp.]